MSDAAESKVDIHDVTSPLMASEPVEIVRCFAVEEIRQRYREHLRIDVSSRLGSTKHVYLCRGRETGIEFFWPNNLAADSSLYEELRKLPGYYAESKWEFNTASELLAEHNSILEVGCGDGHFVSILQNEGHEARGIDFNASAVARAVSEGKRVSLGDFAALEQMRQNGTQFDAICAFQVLEHLADPVRFLSDCIGLLRVGGRLVLAIPDGMGPLAVLDVALDLPPHHMARWNLAALQSLCRLFPIRMHAFRCEPMAAAHLPLLVRSVFNPLRAEPSTLARVRKRVVSALACRYWARHPNDISIRGQTLLVAFDVQAPGQ